MLDLKPALLAPAVFARRSCATWVARSPGRAQPHAAHCIRREQPRDYAALSPWLSAEVELHVYPDAPEARPADLEPVYYGRESYVESGEVWKAGFGEFGWELREALDPGGSRFAARVEMVGHGIATGIETRLTQFHVWQLECGVLRRQCVVASEAAMLALLEGTQGFRSRATAPDPPA